MIESGEVEIGFQQVSELIHEKGIDYLGPLPAEVQKITVFSAGLHTAARWCVVHLILLPILPYWKPK